MRITLLINTVTNSETLVNNNQTLLKGSNNKQQATNLNPVNIKMGISISN